MRFLVIDNHHSPEVKTIVYMCVWFIFVITSFTKIIVHTITSFPGSPLKNCTASDKSWVEAWE